MAWLQSLDLALFRLVNQSLANPLFDRLMPVLSGTRWFIPLVLIAGIALLYKGGRRAKVFVVGLAIAIAVTDGVVCKTLKDSVGRPRPFIDHPEARVIIGKGGSGSMPSSHAANWFAATAVAWLLYRRSIRFMLPMALAVSFSRVYNGVHYPSDVVVGAILGAGTAISALYAFDSLWQWAGHRWFPAWWTAFPSLLSPVEPTPGARSETRKPVPEDHWIRMGYLIIAALLLARLCYLAGGVIELSEDEAYQWQWSKHPALYYYSKPPLIAFVQWLGTAIWGDTAFGIRFFAPVMTAALSLMTFRFLAREIGARSGLLIVLIVSTTPMLAAGSILMSVDGVSVFFWTVAMLAGWRAIQADSTRLWLWTGLWIGLGFLAKFAALVQLPCLFLYLCLSKEARPQLRRPGPYLAILILALCTLPAIVWNAGHDWATLQHLHSRAGLEQAWKPTLRFLVDFTAAEFALLNPIFLVASIWAAVALWRRPRINPLHAYFFCLSVPFFAGCLIYTIRARAQPNWIAPAVLPLLCLMLLHWHERWREGVNAARNWLVAGLSFGLLMVVLLHQTNWVPKIAGRELPPGLDPLDRVRGWKQMAEIVAGEQATLAAKGEHVFIIGSHYGVTSLLSFYLPESRKGLPDHPMVYYESSEVPENQYYFWPGYLQRKGESAIYVEEVKRGSPPGPIPHRLETEFTSIVDLGTREVPYRGRVIHTVRLLACHQLRGTPDE